MTGKKESSNCDSLVTSARAGEGPLAAGDTSGEEEATNQAVGDGDLWLPATPMG